MLPGITGGIIAAAIGSGIEISWETSPSVDSSSPWSFGSVDFGDASTDRRILVAIHWAEGSTHRSVSSVSIGGVSATVHSQDGHSGGLTGFGCAIASAIVPTGTSGTITVTMSSDTGMDKVMINTFIAYGLAETTPFDTASATSSSTATDISDTINVPEGGFVLAVFTSSTNASGKSVTWTGVTEIYDEAPGFNPFVRVSAGIDTDLAAQTGRTIEADVSSNTSDAGNAFVAVSWN